MNDNCEKKKNVIITKIIIEIIVEIVIDAKAIIDCRGASRHTALDLPRLR